MARNRNTPDRYSTALGRLMLGALIVMLLGLFLLWRIDSPRVERLRMEITDRVIPNFSAITAPMTSAVNILRSARSYTRIYQQNQELRRELQQMKAWKEAALQREQENARLLDLNNVRLDPKFTKITGVVLADSGSPFRQTVLLNVGRRDGIVDGWAAIDGIGLVGRIAGVGERTSRVILLTDTASRIAVSIESNGQRAMIVGDNTSRPPLEFLEAPETVRPGDRVLTSGDGGVFPSGLLVGQVTQTLSGRLRVRLAADMQRLEFLRVVRHQPREPISTAGDLVGVQLSEPRGEP
ncbi:rod shape-determining protein MreC [Planktomarina sp.]|uniref:rod shape-determining protein MreC n=1 Tax=Planktomarina sp. TaxID=2024851 RepID=UPI0028901288|nr:rod shape-determining protein MreC [Planktomarina sp.]MDT2031421.1 rod shape-determining protein MreC [Planktomarina sp.]MDT2070709.1 rod shape-determining protein MreC [Planktomarina sp.]